MHQKVNEDEMLVLANKCLQLIQDMHPGNWKDIVLLEYLPAIKIKMEELKTDDPLEAAIPLFNDPAEHKRRIWWLAAGLSVINDRKYSLTQKNDI